MKQLLFLFTTLLISTLLSAQKLRYDVSFPNIVHHEAVISLTASGIKQQPALFRMSRSSPGRYATHEFGKNVYNVTAFDQSGKPLIVDKVDADVYEVTRHTGYVKIVYTLYGDYADGTYAGIDPGSVHFNMPAAFMWIKGYDAAPIEIHFDIPKEKKWTIATQLKPAAEANTFTAPGLQYFMDSPTKLGDLIWKKWELSNPGGKQYQFNLALEAAATDEEAAEFAEKVSRITREAQAVYGEVPDFDYGSYTFIASINPYVHGDGMEHRNSTMITTGIKFNNSNNLLGVFSHEFFHCWNVERIRPKTLEPFNFEKSNMSDELWFAEGFTQYYGNLIMERAGLIDQNRLLNGLAGLINTKENTPGATRYSPVTMSRNAVFVDAGVAVDKTNFSNMHTSYYPYGGAIALALDLELRSTFNTTLDDYMQAVWKKFGKPEQPYTVAGLQEVLAQFTKNAAFAKDFFAKYINGHESFDYASLLAKAGLLLSKPDSADAWMGQVHFISDNELVISSNTLFGTPVYNAGLDVGDIILELDGKSVKTNNDIRTILKDHQPGDVIPVKYQHRGDNKASSIKLTGNPSYSLVTYEKAGMVVSQDMLAFRNSWLQSQLN